MPGPSTVKLLVANVTSWRASWTGLLAAGADVHCVQEARIPASEDIRTAAQGAASRRGLQLEPGCIEKDSDQHLLAFAWRRGKVSMRTHSIEGLQPEHIGRLQYAVMHLGRRQSLHIVQIYGHADGQQKDDNNEKLIMAAMAWLRSLGDVPAVIVGDFNLLLPGTGVASLLAMSGWCDVLADAGPTCLPSSGRPSRIDYILANKPATTHIVVAGL